MQCPICDIPMRITEREGIEIDYCPQCRGVWLDRGELEKMIARVEGQDLRRREPDEDDYEYDDEDSPFDFDELDPTRRREHESRRDKPYRQDRSYRGRDESRHGGRKREGFLSNLFEMLGGD